MILRDEEIKEMVQELICCDDVDEYDQEWIFARKVEVAVLNKIKQNLVGIYKGRQGCSDDMQFWGFYSQNSQIAVKPNTNLYFLEN